MTALVLGGVLPARADYALLQDGRTLFNVRVVDTQSTAAGPMQIVYKVDSFGYNFYTDSSFLLRGRSETYPVADYVTTTVAVGKQGARDVILSRNWQAYVPPRPAVIPKFRTAPPTPVPTATPVPTPPPNVADASLPIDQRIQRQLDIFIHEQQTLAEQLKLMARAGKPDVEAQKQQRLQLLKTQVQILDNYYPATDDLVTQAKEALLHHQDFVKEKGKFNFED